MQGSYLVGYIETKDENILKSISDIKKAMLAVCDMLDLKVVGDKHHLFKGSNGITYCFILSQSHFVVHTWPEINKVYFDIFTCNKKLDTKKSIKILSQEFNGVVKEIKKIDL